MAQLPSVTPYNVQVTGVGSAATPGVSFGAQRRPEVAYQAQAQYQQTLSKALDRISSTLFGVAEKSAERAGKQFVADQPADELTLQAMVSGNPEVIQGAMRNLGAGGSSMNVYSAAVNKARAIELSAYAEREGQKLMQDLETRVAGGMKALDAINEFSNHVDGVSSGLADIEPDASFKYRATMATIGRSFINNVASTELKRVRTINMAATNEAYELRINDIARELNKEVVDPNVFETVTKLQENFLVNATVTVGEGEAAKYAERFKKDILEIQTNMAASYVELGGDPYDNYNKLRLGRTGNPLLDAMMAPNAPTSRAMRDAALKALTNAETVRKQQESIKASEAKMRVADFADQIAVGDVEGMKSTLRDIRSLDPVEYAKLKKDFDDRDTVFARRDNQMVVADLERRLNDPYREKVTVSEIFNLKNNLTQSTYTRLINSAKSMEDEQIRIMEKELASTFGMTSQIVLNPNIQRQKQEKKLAEAKSRFIQMRRDNPDLNAMTFIKDQNILDQVDKQADKVVNTEVINRIQSRQYKSLRAFDDAIQKAQMDATRKAELTRQRAELEDAIKNKIVDENGNAITQGR
jgi:hypothetical protein